MVCAYLSLRHALLLTALYASFSDITMAAVTNLSVPVNIDPQQPSILGLRIADELSWSTHATLFGSRLHASIKSPSSLKLSLALAKRWDQTTPSRSVGMANVTSSPPSIGCTTYKRGQKLGNIMYKKRFHDFSIAFRQNFNYP